jgi:hypothetical protein
MVVVAVHSNPVFAVGAHHSTLTYAQATALIDGERLAQYLDAFKRLSGTSSAISLSEFQAHFVRPSVSAPVARRVFRALVSYSGSDDAQTPALAVHDFVRGVVALCESDAAARVDFAFWMFADASRKSNALDETAFVTLWAPAVALAACVGFKLRALPPTLTPSASMAELVRAGQEQFHSMTQKKPDALRFADFAVWCDHGNSELVQFIAYCVQKTLFPDYVLPPTHPLRPSLSIDAKVVGGLTCALLSPSQLSAVCARMPSEISPPASSLLAFYSTARNGFSMTTLISLHDKAIKLKQTKHHAVLLVVRTTDGETFGAFSATPLKLRIDHAHGDARESFVFRAAGADVDVFAARDNKHAAPCLFFLNDEDLPGGYAVAIGGRDGFHALQLDGSLTGGVSNVTSTFGGEPLVSKSSDGRFKVAAVEAFAFVPPIDETREPIFKQEKEIGVLEKGAESAFILELIGQGHSANLPS